MDELQKPEFKSRWQEVKSESDLWRVVEKELRKAVSDDIRTYIKGNFSYVTECVEATDQADFAEGLQGILKAIKELPQLNAGIRKRNGSSQPEDFIYAPTEYDDLMRDALCTYLEAEVTILPDVIEYRRLLGTLFQDEELAWAFLESDAARLLSWEQITSIGGDLARNLWFVKPDDNGDIFRYWVSNDSSVTEDYMFMPLVPPAVDSGSHVRDERARETTFDVAFSGDDILTLENHINDVVVGNSFISGSLVRLASRSECRMKASADGDDRRIEKNRRILKDYSSPDLRAFRGTVSGWALQIASEITRTFYINPEDALMLLLTGRLRRPQLISYQGTTRQIYETLDTSVASATGEPFFYWGHGPICLAIQPWMAADNVAKSYRVFQTKLFNGDNRPVTKSSVALFQFVNEARKTGKRLRTLCRLWNAEQANKSNTARLLSSRNFWKTYRITRDKLFPESASSKIQSKFRFKMNQQERYPDFPTLSFKEKQKLRQQWDQEWEKMDRKSRSRRED